MNKVTLDEFLPQQVNISDDSEESSVHESDVPKESTSTNTKESYEDRLLRSTGLSTYLKHTTDMNPAELMDELNKEGGVSDKQWKAITVVRRRIKNRQAAERSRQARISRIKNLRAEAKLLRRQKNEMVQERQDLLEKIKEVERDIWMMHSRRALRRALDLESSYNPPRDKHQQREMQNTTMTSHQSTS